MRQSRMVRARLCCAMFKFIQRRSIDVWKSRAWANGQDFLLSQLRPSAPSLIPQLTIQHETAFLPYHSLLPLLLDNLGCNLFLPQWHHCSWCQLSTMQTRRVGQHVLPYQRPKQSWHMSRWRIMPEWLRQQHLARELHRSFVAKSKMHQIVSKWNR